MKNLKRILLSVIVMIMVFSITSNTLFASAADYGTYEDGLKAQTGNYGLYATRYEGNHPNLNFEKGLEGWTTKKQNKFASEFGKIKKEENGNTYVTITAQQNYDSISTIKFTDPRIKVGDQLSVMIKWRGADKNFQPVLSQIKDNAQGKFVEYVRLADNGIVEQIKYPDSEKDWGVIVCTGLKSKVVEADKGDPTLLFGISLEVFGDLTISVDLDDVQIVRYNNATRKVMSLDGELIYDAFAADSEAAQFKSEAYGDLGFDFSKKFKAPEPDSFDGKENAKKKNESINADVSDENGSSNGSNVLMWVIIAVCVVLVAGSSVVLLVVIKKKKESEKKDSDDADEKVSDSDEKNDSKEE